MKSVSCESLDSPLNLPFIWVVENADENFEYSLNHFYKDQNSWLDWK